GMWVLYNLVNPLTMWLTFATFVGYAVIYTIILKPATPQNIVIGGLSGAMPPALGWAAIANDVPMQAWILVLIIFTWTPPHFWALALYRRSDYAAAGLPMLPVTHGVRFTKLWIVLYTLLLFPVTALPWIMGMSGILYGLPMQLWTGVFLYKTLRLYYSAEESYAMHVFRFSIWYLFALFLFLLLDHWLKG
ncbi:protoheme IX farnesyltransferase, partial [bacterium]|nr:protoheme IX farnesyltransferase [bacterium]